MATIPPLNPNLPPAEASRELAELRHYVGPPKEFWPRYLACLGNLLGASKTVLLRRNSDNLEAWSKLVEWSANQGTTRHHGLFLSQLEKMANECVQDRRQVMPLEPGNTGATGHFVITAQLQLHHSEEVCVAACLLSDFPKAQAHEALLRLNLAADTPELYQICQASLQAKVDVEKLALVLDVMTQVNAEKKFLAGALAFCNGLATRFNCDRVSLGWLEGGFIRLRTISRTEKFDRQMAAAQALEKAMEEALDQDDEVLWPAPEGSTVVNRDHERFAKELKAGHICSIPLRSEDKPTAVLTCERQATPFTALEVQQLRLCCDQAIHRLAGLKDSDRWFGARWASTSQAQLGKILSPEHTWAKALALTVALALGLLFFLRIDYRVEGNFILRSDELVYLTAPFDGYISQVAVRPGDNVAAKSTLVRLNTAELELEESAARADLNRYEREAEKARATNALAEMRVALALAEQAQARLDLVRYRIEQAAIKAPFAAIVVEGDLREKLGAPVKQGDALLKVGRIDTLYVEAEVNERDVHEVLGKTSGEIAFVSQPKLKYPVRIVTIEPAAVPKPDGNIFLVRCEVPGSLQTWWRPGMSGLCKINVEKRSLIWILTHRTVDFLRMKLWW